MLVEYHLEAIIPDNDTRYFSLLEAVVEAVDSHSQMSVQRSGRYYHLRIIPSDGRLINSLVEEITTLSNLVGIEMELSKSMKALGTLHFSIPL